MILSFRRVVRLSRPRFWIYLLGPYLVGIFAALESPTHANHLFWHLPVWAFLAYFLLPANLLVYGVNDIFDYETDQKNPKKQGYEGLLDPSRQTEAWLWIGLWNAPFFAIAPILPPTALLGFVAFLFLSVFYSAPPIRAKALPFVDMAFNALYVFPGIVGFGIAGGVDWHRETLIAAVLWCMAMHAYSAVPDIAADRSAGIATVATKLGRERTLLLCGAFYLVAAILSSHERSIGGLAFLLGAGYLTLLGASWRAKDAEALQRIYAVFPIFNTLSGAAITLRILTELV